MKYVNGSKVFEVGDEVVVSNDLSDTNEADFLEKIKEILIVADCIDDDGLNLYYCKYKSTGEYVTKECDGETNNFPFTTADLVDFKTIGCDNQYEIVDIDGNSIGNPYSTLKDAISETIKLREELEKNSDFQDDDEKVKSYTTLFSIIDKNGEVVYSTISAIHFKHKNPIRFQILANTGETIGLPLEDINVALEYVEELKVNKEFLEETCPDSDISEITDFSIYETKNY